MPRKRAMFWKVRATPRSAMWFGLSRVTSDPSRTMRPESG